MVAVVEVGIGDEALDGFLGIVDTARELVGLRAGKRGRRRAGGRRGGKLMARTFVFWKLWILSSSCSSMRVNSASSLSVQLRAVVRSCRGGLCEREGVVVCQELRTLP